MTKSRVKLTAENNHLMGSNPTKKKNQKQKTTLLFSSPTQVEQGNAPQPNPT